EYIERDSPTNMRFKRMFEEAPPPVTPGQEAVKNYADLLYAFNDLLGRSPIYDDAGGLSAMVGAVPYYALIARFCNTPSGFNAFADPVIDGFLRRMINDWHTFLVSSSSTYVLTENPEDGWFRPSALDAMIKTAGGDPQRQTFEDIYECDTSQPHYGFTNYDHFFIKELVETARVPDDPDNDNVIIMACSSNIHTLTYQGNNDAQRLQEESRFWIKETPYSLRHILGGDELTSRFVRGSLMQAMLSSLDYHGWRSPVNGRVVKTVLIPGTHYCGLVDPTSEDPDPISRSQDFVTAVSTRALIFIEAAPPVGLMVFVGVGLGEVSTCEIKV
ncbi:hypothetical protein ID866_13308, partial [Astraeus odoratus]